MNKELKRLKNKNLPCSNCKALKALEIIKNKEIDTVLFNDCPDLDEYNEWASDKSQLTKEEYDLLKEVLE